MSARLLAIDVRQKPFAVAPAAATDFATHPVGDFEAGALATDPTLSLYCLDLGRREALFVRTPPELDLTAAAFLYQTQYSAATELVAVPFAELHRVAATVEAPSERLVFVYSVGRCGSTLVSKAFAAADGVVSLSEPDFFWQLHALQDAGDPELDTLVASCIRLLCAPRPARAWAIKLRSHEIELADALRRSFPEAKSVFLYRDADSWARSAARAFGFFSPETLAGWDPASSVFPRLRSLVDGPVPEPFASPVELMAWLWATSVARAIALRDAGVQLVAASYAELQSDPEASLAALLARSGLTIDPAALAAVAGADSQAGTELSREQAAVSTSELTPERHAAFRRRLAEIAPGLPPDPVFA